MFQTLKEAANAYVHIRIRSLLNIHDGRSAEASGAMAAGMQIVLGLTDQECSLVESRIAELLTKVEQTDQNQKMIYFTTREVFEGICNF